MEGDYLKHFCFLCLVATERIRYGKYDMKNRFNIRYFGRFIPRYNTTFICEDHYGQICNANVDPPCAYLVHEKLGCDFCNEKTEHNHKKYIDCQGGKCFTRIYDYNINGYLSVIPRDILNIIKQYVVYN
jgi:hypothetical protein